MAISIADSSNSSPRSSLAFLLDPDKVEPPRPKQSMWHRLGLRRWLGRDDRDFHSRSPASASNESSPPASNDRFKGNNTPPKSHDNLTRRLSRKVGVGLPRSTTFKRQESERRDRLSPVDSEPRPRAISADRRTLSLQRTKSPQSVVDPRLSAPEINWPRDETDPDPDPSITKDDEPPAPNEETTQDNDVRSEWDHYPEVTDTPEGYPVDSVDMELDRRWILNLSMHFRDRSEREKFFVTYAEAANRWRRVTISCDYRDAEPESLEQDLKELRYQRDKCARIYESIRESLPEIQFYDTVTNLKLETRDGRLHVHVTEDVNEIIPYPPISSIGHLPEARLVPERWLHFEAHLSGFVYNVRLGDKSFIKKEIPGPDTVDEFLYEINALHALQGIPNVIQVEGIVVDDRQEVVKGLLISFAEKGALVDILYEYRGTISWERRERWARQIVQGLCEIHEAGYVQGDFTLSNIVVDANDDAKIIDINRRGCPVGWEPPEIAAKIESNQRISMYIGVKTDLFQLGMTLWALAMEEDEPERQRRPFVLDGDVPVPDYYRRLVSICLSPSPRQRLSAKELLALFPPETGTFDQLPRMQPHTSIGVGLHNGALPLYDSRAAFLYSRGRQMGNFAHSNTHIPQQPPIDGSESIHAPGTDRTVSDTEEQEQRMELYDEAVQSNGFRKSESLIFDERSSVVDDMVQTRLSARPEDTPQSRRSPPIDYAENEFDVDPRYRSSSTDMTMVDPTSNGEPLSDGLVGDKSWKISSENSSIHYNAPEQPATTQAPADIYPVDSVTESPSSLEPLHPVPTLLLSSLPINPAAESLEQVIVTTGDILPPSNVALENTQQAIDQPSTYLSDSVLPINPAAKALERALQGNVDSQPQSSIQSTSEYPQDGALHPRLSDSSLPMNSVTKQLESVDLSAVNPSNNQKAEVAPEWHQQVIQTQIPDSSVPHLSVNPETESTADLKPEVGTSFIHGIDSTQHTEQTSQDQNQGLSNSQLPINPATITSGDISSDDIDASLTPIAQSIRCTQQTIRGQNQSSFLRNSHLPINPAITSPGETIGYEAIIKPGINARSTSYDLPVIQDSNQNSFLSTSRLPINPAAKCSNEGTYDNTMPPTTINAQPTPNSRHGVHDRSFHLNDSHLPINPAFTDKALQSV
ncbi:protein kinase family protein [Aspergillus foveolatus]|uniref:protein kinase family protein n=1 Tax=Aspergillus foveolatus TaxID=210207 RepID=UPI003CCDD5AB